MHADFAPESTLSGFFGWMLASLGQEHGFPVPEGGSGKLTEALVRRLESRGGRVVCDTPVTGIEVRGRRAVAVRTADGDEIGVTRAVLADVGAPALYGELVRPEHLPARILDGMQRFQYDHGTFKVDWALDGPVPWTAPGRPPRGHRAPRRLDGPPQRGRDAARDRPDPGAPVLPRRPDDDHRPDTLPRGHGDAVGVHPRARATRAATPAATSPASGTSVRPSAFADRIEAEIEARAPGFRDRIVDATSLHARRCSKPPTPTSWAGR